MIQNNLKKHPGHHMISAPLIFLTRAHLKKELTAFEIQAELQLSQPQYVAFINDEMEIDEDIAKRMAKLIGNSSTFWLNWDKAYKEHLDYLHRVNALCQPPNFLDIYK